MTSPLPSFSLPSHPDGGHKMTSPGGYEWWYFDAEDESSDAQIVAILLDGFVFHPGYLRQHFRYLKNPTRRQPARALDFPCAYFVIYEKGKISAQFMTQYAPGSFVALGDSPTVTLGDNTLRPVGLDGSLELCLAGHPWKITGRGPQTDRSQTLSVWWRNTPVSVHPPCERPFLSKAMTGARHEWVVANPHSRFEARISLGTRTWNLKGRSYHDHNYGTGPLGPGLKRWIWGRALFDDACYTFHYAVPRNPGLRPEPHLLRITPACGVEELDVEVTAEFNRTSPLLLKYPDMLRFGNVMTLSKPRVIDLAPFYMRLMYQAECEGRIGQAFCEVAYPHRLRWPVLGRMVEMSFDKRTTPNVP